jgi:MinD-like ATPase involved in chromosome partitioning or flagellar assembly
MVWQTELKKRLEDIYVTNSNEWIELQIDTNGLLNLSIVSDRFDNISWPDREQRIQEILSEYKISSGFLSFYTLTEAKNFEISQTQISDKNRPIHRWQDLAIWAANPQNHQPPLDSSNTRIPRTVSFYSFKGGVGRTTALTHVAWILAKRGRKVVAVDLDLEAPGLSTAFALKPQPRHGIVDYFYDRSYVLADDDHPPMAVTDIFGEVNIPDSLGRLFVVPAGNLDLDYISKVDDLRAATILENGETLWSTFSNEIQEHLKPDVILVDSRTGINEWGALSLFQAAEEAIIFLFPNEQNHQGINLLLKSLNAFGRLSLNFVFSPVPDVSAVGMAKIQGFWQRLQASIEVVNGEKPDEEGGDSMSLEAAEPLLVPYLQPIATAEHYPVIGLLDYYNKIANLVDESTNAIITSATPISHEKRWEIVKSLSFPPLNAGALDENLGDLFQRTSNFDKFLDETTCLIKGRKGTGKTALYLLLIKHPNVAKRLARGRLENVEFLAGHGAALPHRPTRNEFQIINEAIDRKNGSWESFWRAYLLFRIFIDIKLQLVKIITGEKFQALRDILQSLPKDTWSSEHTKVLIRLSTEVDFRLIIPDALTLLNDRQKKDGKTIWLLYDDLDEDFPEKDGIRQKALTGLFQLIQACDARRLTSIRFKIFLREDIWSHLNFDNKSHFNGRDLLLKWTRVDFLRLALRQALRSAQFKDLVDRSSPVESIDQANEEVLNKALETLWGSRRRSGSKAKYVSRWSYERLTDASGTTFPRSLSALLEGAKGQELTYQGQTSVQIPTDRLLRSKSLDKGLEESSKERCAAIRQEYPDLDKFFDALANVAHLPSKEELENLWQSTVQDIIPDFADFADQLSEIGVVSWREKESRYCFADIYIYGFKMSRIGQM